MLKPEDLKAKGWNDYEIHQAMEILNKADQEKHPGSKFWNESLYWIFLIITVLGNLAFSIALIPFFISLPSVFVYTMAGFTGVIFGTLGTTLMKTIEKFEMKHYLFYFALIVIIGMGNFIIIVKQANLTASLVGGLVHNAYLIGLTYLAFFFLPDFLLMRKTPWN